MNNINGKLKRAALINDLSCFGKCSLSVAMPIISACGVETVPLPTAVLSTHTAGFEGYAVQDMTEQMRAFSAHWKRLGMRFDGILTGFFCSAEQIGITAQFIEDFAGEGTKVIVDPVLGDNGRMYPCFDESYLAGMKKLCGYADIITPNRTEALLLTGLPEDTDDGALLGAFGDRDVIITSAERGGKTGYLARLGGKTIRIEKEKLSLNLHGCGDVFAAALCGEIVGGAEPEAALRSAADFCDSCVHDTARLWPEHWYGPCFEKELERRRANG